MPPAIAGAMLLCEGDIMRSSARAVAHLGAAALLGGLLGGCALLTPVERFSDEATVTEEIATVELDDPRGSVTVIGDDDATEVSISRTLRYRGERPEGETHEVDGDVLVLSGCGRRCSVEYTIEVPARVDVRGSTANGRIELSAVGEVEVQTSNGRIELEDVTGSVDAETSNGRVIGRDLNGDGVRVTTSNGAIELELGEPQDVEARSTNGAITLEVPQDSYQVSTQTSNGSTDIDLPNDADGRFSLDLRTTNGSITVTEED
jgi:hypothetical protein